MSDKITITGAEMVDRNLNRAIARIKGQTEAGMIAALALVEAKAKEYTPVDTGNLIGSYDTIVMPTGAGPVGIITVHAVSKGKDGSDTSYAQIVHDRQGVSYKKPTAKAFFLRDALYEMRDAVLATIKAYAAR